MLIGRGLFGLLALALGRGLGMLAPSLTMPPHAPRPGAPRRRRKRSNYYTPNGKRECARRRNQIVNGQLRVSA